MTLYHRTLPNGLQVLVEEMDHVESVSYEISIPGGLISDDIDSIGGAIVFAEMLSKGAGEYDSRGLAEEFDQHGIRHGEGSGLNRFTLAGSAVGAKYQRALELTSLMILAPTLPEPVPNTISLVLESPMSSILRSDTLLTHLRVIDILSSKSSPAAGCGTPCLNQFCEALVML